MAKVIVHIDLNAFFVRAEEIKNPSLEGKPVAVGGEGRCGIVSTCSYKAREFGVSSGMPMFQAKNLCPQLIVVNEDFRFYWALSDTFMNFVRNYTKIVETASVDECFADFTDAIKGVKDVEGYFRNIQTELCKKTKLKCSIGVGPTKFLAKMGSDYKKPMGLTIIRKKDISKILFPLSIDKMFGVGKKSVPKLKAMDINTIGDLYQKITTDENVINYYGKFKDDIIKCLTGTSSDILDTGDWDLKSIGNSHTLYQDTDDFGLIQSAFESLAKEVSERAKKDHKLGTTIQIVVKETASTNFKTHNKSKTIDHLFNDYETIFDIATSLYKDNFKSLTVRMVGITLQNLVDIKDAKIQMSLFNYQEHEEQNMTRLLINDFNRKLSKPSLIRASELKDKKDGNK